ncbi:hypothetical protein N9L19_00185, partial [bacterium]|nr:hypothetical protein [bacterium]
RPTVSKGGAWERWLGGRQARVSLPLELWPRMKLHFMKCVSCSGARDLYVASAAAAWLLPAEMRRGACDVKTTL